MNSAIVLEQPKARAPVTERDDDAPVFGEQRVFLENVSWKTFEALLKEKGDRGVPRFAYDDGVLEIMAPYFDHESSSTLIDHMVYVLCEELGIDCKGAGKLTCKRSKKKKGLEPDACFYIENEALVRGKKRVDLKKDPPPDLMIEIDISRSSMDKFGIYAALEVNEVWVFDGTTLAIFERRRNSYRELPFSPHFPGLPLTSKIPEILTRSESIGDIAALKEFRAWVRSHTKKAR